MNDSSIFAIIDPHHHIQGTGFLVADKLGVTCAHVVQRCGKGPGDELDIHFLDVGETITVRVMPEYWHEDEDVAFLSLPQETPIKKAPLHLRAANRSMDASVKSYGFPDTPTEGLYAQGTVLGLVKDGKERRLVQLNSTEITKGFSGAPIWDAQTYQVIGMVTAVLKADSLGRLAQTAFASPSETLVKLHPFLALHDPAGDLVKGITRLPFGYDTRIKNFITDYLEAPFGGREADMAVLDAWLTTPDAPPYALLAAEAGRGKSALLVQWIQTVQARNLAEIAFVPVSLRYNTAQATTIFTSLAVRLGVVYQEHMPYAQLSAEEWKSVCAKYLERTPTEGKPILVILDGLDEATDWQAGPDLFPIHPSEGVRVLVSARYQAGDKNANGWLTRLGWEKAGRARTFPLDYLTEHGVRDVLTQMGNPLDKLATQVDVIHELFRLSEGDPLLVRLYVEALLPYGNQAANLNPVDLARLETGLGGFFDRWWEDQKKQWGEDNPLKAKYVSTTLNLLACALAPLGKADLISLAPPESELNTWTLEDALDGLRRFVIGDGDTQGYVFTHPRLGNYFYDKLKAERQKWEQYFLDYGKRTLENLNQTPNNLPEFLAYPMQTYGAHLTRAECSSQDFYNLVSEGWMRAWYKLEGTYSGFLTDVDRVWQRADAEKNIGLQIKCALCHSSVQTLSDNFDHELMALAVENHLISPTQAFVMVEKNSNERSKVDQLTSLAHFLPVSLFKPALAIAQAIQIKEYKTKALTGLVPHLPPAMQTPTLCLAWETAQVIWDEEERAEALIRLAPCLTPDLLHQARETAQAIEDRYWQARALTGLIPYLPLDSRPQTIRQAWETTLTIRDKAERAEALISLAPYLPPDLLHQARETAQAIEDRYWQARALTGLIPYLPLDSRPQTIRQAWEITLTIWDKAERAEALISLAPYLPPDLLHQARETAQAIWDEEERASVLIGLIPYLPLDVRPPTIRLAWETVQAIKNEYWRTNALIELVPYFPPDLLRQAWEIAQAYENEGERVRALSGLIPYLPIDLQTPTLRLVMATAQGIKDGTFRDLALTGLVPYLTSDLIQQVLEIVQANKHANEQAHALIELVPYLPPGLLYQALETAQTIQEEETRAKVITGLVPYLPMEMQIPVLRLALETVLAIKDGYWRTCALNKLVPYLPPDLLRQTLESVQAIANENEQAEVLTGLVPYLPPDLLYQALETAQNIQEEETRAKAIIGLIPYLPTEIQTPVLRLMLETVQAFDKDDFPRAKFLVDMAPHLLPNLLQQALEIVQYIRDESERAEALGGLASHLVSDLQTPNLCLALEITQTIENEIVRARAISGLAPFLTPDLFHQALETAKAIENEEGRTKALTGLAPYLPSELQIPTLRLALESIQAIRGPGGRARALTAVASYLPPELLQQALEIAQNIRFEISRINALTGLISYLPLELHLPTIRLALETYQALEEDGERFLALMDLVPFMPIELFPAALQILQSYSDSPHHIELLNKFMPFLLTLVHKKHHEIFLSWKSAIHIFTHYPRRTVFHDLAILTPFILELSPDSKEQTATEIYHAIQEVCEWWP